MGEHRVPGMEGARSTRDGVSTEYLGVSTEYLEYSEHCDQGGVEHGVLRIE